MNMPSHTKSSGVPASGRLPTEWVVRDQMRIWGYSLWTAGIFFTALNVCLLLTAPLAKIGDVYCSIFLVGVDLLLLGAVGYVTVLRLRSGGSRFEFSTYPAVVGGPVAGTIVTGKPLQFSAPVHLKLTCSQYCLTAHPRRKVIWQGEQPLSLDLPTDAHGTRIPVYFDFPPHCHPSKPRGDNAIIWQLSAQSPMSGVVYFARFTIKMHKGLPATTAMDSPK